MRRWHFGLMVDRHPQYGHGVIACSYVPSPSGQLSVQTSRDVIALHGYQVNCAHCLELFRHLPLIPMFSDRGLAGALRLIGPLR